MDDARDGSYSLGPTLRWTTGRPSRPAAASGLPFQELRDLDALGLHPPPPPSSSGIAANSFDDAASLPDRPDPVADADTEREFPRYDATVPIEALVRQVSRRTLNAKAKAMVDKVGICLRCGAKGQEHRGAGCLSNVIQGTETPARSTKAQDPDGRFYVKYHGRHSVKELCYSFNVFASCRSEDCVRRHLCSLCSGKHSAVVCRRYREQHVRDYREQVWQDDKRVHQLAVDRVVHQEWDRAHPAGILGERRGWKTTVLDALPDHDRELPQAHDIGLIANPNDPDGRKIRQAQPPPPTRADIMHMFPLNPCLLNRSDPRKTLPTANKVLLDPGVHAQLTLDWVCESAPEHVRAAVSVILRQAGVAPDPASYQQLRANDHAMLDRVNAEGRAIEQRLAADPQSMYEDGDFTTVPAMGRSGRFQRCDGTLSGAGVHILLHYPPIHPSHLVLCDKKFTTRMLMKMGMPQPEAKDGLASVAVWNLLPVKCSVNDLNQPRCPIRPPSNRDVIYPKACRDHFAKSRAQYYARQVREGRTILLTVLTTAAGRDFFALLEECLDQGGPTWEKAEWTCSTPPLLGAELGLEDAPSIMLKEMSRDLTRPVGGDAAFGSHTAMQNDYNLDRHGRHTSPPVKIPFRLYTCADQPASGLVIMSLNHPEILDQNTSTYVQAQSLDMGIAFARETALGRLTADPPYFEYPPFPGCMHLRRVKQERTVKGDEASHGIEVLKGYWSWQAVSALARKLLDLQQALERPAHGPARLIRAVSLPPGIRTRALHARIEECELPPEVPNEVLRDRQYRGYATDLVRHLYTISQSRLASAQAEAPRTDAQQTQTLG